VVAIIPIVVPPSEQVIQAGFSSKGPRGSRNPEALLSGCSGSAHHRPAAPRRQRVPTAPSRPRLANPPHPGPGAASKFSRRRHRRRSVTECTTAPAWSILTAAALLDVTLMMRRCAGGCLTGSPRCSCGRSGERNERRFRRRDGYRRLRVTLLVVDAAPHEDAERAAKPNWQPLSFSHRTLTADVPPRPGQGN
jgi:hypothetical protein